jgi:hypothetical protein
MSFRQGSLIVIGRLSPSNGWNACFLAYNKALHVIAILYVPGGGQVGLDSTMSSERSEKGLNAFDCGPVAGEQK